MLLTLFTYKNCQLEQLVQHMVFQEVHYMTVSGRVKVGCKKGPDSVLTAMEETRLVQYVIHMASIGYGCSREQILEEVKSILDKDGRPNPFKDNKPGRKWWLLFKRRHPEILLCTPESLQISRIKTDKLDLAVTSDTHNVLKAIEKLMKPETIDLYCKRFTEGYDVTSDEFYVVWSKLKDLSLADETKDDVPTEEDGPTKEDTLCLPKKQRMVSPAFDEILTYPNPAAEKAPHKRKGTSYLLKHSSSDQCIEFLQAAKDKKEEEREKIRKREEREKKKLENEEKKKREVEQKRLKAIEKEKRQQDVAGRRRGQGQRTHCRQRQVNVHRSRSESKREYGSSRQHYPSSSDESIASESDEPLFPICNYSENDTDAMVACDVCDRWYHFLCVDINPDSDLTDVEWKCLDCY